MRTVQILTLVLLTIVLSSPTSNGQAPAYFFHDDFEDGDPYDFDPAIWARGVWHGAVDYVEDGDYYIDGTLEGISVLSLKAEDGRWMYYDDVSIRAQARLTDLGEHNAFLSLLSRTPVGGGAFLGYVNRYGEVGVQEGPGPIQREEVSTDIDPAATDVIMQLDTYADEVSWRVWKVGEERPDLPMVSIRSSRLPTGAIDMAVGASSGPGATASAAFRWFEAVPIIPGDVNVDDQLTAHDIDLLAAGIRVGVDSDFYDVNQDDEVNELDHASWVKDVAKTYYGDANLDGEFNSGDLVAVFEAGQYEDAIDLNSGWASGDWTGDSEFTSADLVRAFQDGGYEQGPRGAVNVVPEPTSIVLLMGGLIGVAFYRRRTG